MNVKIYIMALATISVGLVELVVGGILPVIANDFNVSISRAGQLITIFALVYAIAGPLLLNVTSHIERKRLYIITLAIFVGGNIWTYFSHSFVEVVLARIVTAGSTALIVVLSLTLAVKMVDKTNQAKALGIIYMGISSSLVLGVPVGVMIADKFGWRIIFLGIALLAVCSMILIAWTFERMEGEKMAPLGVQMKSLGSGKVIGAHLATLLMLAGHFALYAYFTLFLEKTMDLSAGWISICYLLFGIAAVSGGAFGGGLSDKIGPQKSMTIVLIAFAISLALLPVTTFSLLVFLPVMCIWGALSWALSPAQQSYLIEMDGETAAVQQSFNNSALQIGISAGSAIGGIVLGSGASVVITAFIGSGIVLLALACARYSFRTPYVKAKGLINEKSVS